MAYESTKRNERRVIELVIYCALIILGGYMTFFNNPMEQKEDNTMLEAVEGVDYFGKELPENNNVSADELYNDKGIENVSVYFSNTEKLDKGNLPLEAQIILTEDVQKYLNVMGFEDVTELYLYEESYQESDERISFICFMDGHREALQIEYCYEKRSLEYHILPDGADLKNEEEK